MIPTAEEIEAIARAIAYETGYTWGSSALDHDAFRQAALTAWHAARPAILEEAAKELDGWGDIYGDNAAAAIRALKEKPNG